MNERKIITVVIVLFILNRATINSYLVEAMLAVVFGFSLFGLIEKSING